MTWRPSDWSDLDRERDPVPGDHDRVRSEATYYDGLADTLRDQISRLRRLAEPDDALKGDYSEALRDSCDELAGDLEKAKGRFETVGSQLHGVVGPLDTALRDTKNALDDAADARRRMRAAEAAGYDPDSTADAEDPKLDDEQQKWERANDDLDTAKGACTRAVETYESVVESAASKIRDACDDDMKDGRFEGFKAWVKAHADILKEISKWLGRIVLVLAVAILILSNPAGWLIALAFLAGAALLAVDVMLAVAGEGSWWDVALDVVGLLTLGTGSLLGKMAKMGRSGTLLRAGSRSGVRTMAQTFRNAFNNPGVRGMFTNVRNVFRLSSYTRPIQAGWQALRTAMRTPMASVPMTVQNLPRVLTQGRGSMAMADDLAAITRTFEVAPTALHSWSVGSLATVNQVGSVALYLDTLTDEGTNFEVPGLSQLDGLMDDLTTVEVPSL